MRARHDHAHGRAQESMPEFRVRLTTKFIHKNCGSGSIPLNVFRCRIPALFPADWGELVDKNKLVSIYSCLYVLKEVSTFGVSLYWNIRFSTLASKHLGMVSEWG